MDKKGKSLRCVVIKVITPHFHRADALNQMDEIDQLVTTLGGKVLAKEIQHRVKPDNATYIGKGKLEWLSAYVAENKVDVVILDDRTNSGQLYRLEKALWPVNPQIKVWDRVDVILHIFEKHATTTEAKLQIELAKIQHEGPRAYGLGKDRLSRQGGGIGTRGAGETNIEFERRLVKKRTSQLKKQLKKVTRQKQSRISHRITQGLGPVALVGYTSAGKTTLFNRLTGKSKQTHAGLFTTLDTVVGKMKAPNESEPVVISDTIGFIQALPPQLIEAFKSTLMESLQAELLLHVIDASDPRMIDKIESVDAILEELKVTQPIYYVYNKADRINDQRRTQLERLYPEKTWTLVSAKSGVGITQLKQLIRDQLTT